MAADSVAFSSSRVSTFVSARSTRDALLFWLASLPSMTCVAIERRRFGVVVDR